mgnify:FL=1|tara:strand:- start:235 stop:735 length:501 start_codon:yes stop_codon:yes gene_type:complete
MVFDATFWVAISFIIFFGVLIYLKVPVKINESLNKLIADIKNELQESEKLRKETKEFLDQSQSKLNTASDQTKVIIESAKKDANIMIQQMKEKFNKSAEIKKRLAEEKITQMKEQAIKEITNSSLDIALTSVEKIIKNSIDKSKLDNIFRKNIEESKEALKKLKSN